MDSLGDQFFPNLFQEGSNFDQQFMECQSQDLSQVRQVTQKESQFSVQKESVTKKSRGGFSVEEDNMLVSAWLNTSLNAVQGNEKKNKTFRMRIWEYFHKNKNFISERNDISLMNRLFVIQLATSEFCGYLAQIESMHGSGKTEQDKIRDAKFMYQEMCKSGASFQLEHCWNELKHQPKWIAECKKKKPKRGRSVATPSPELINLEEVSHKRMSQMEQLKEEVRVIESRKNES